MFKLPAFEFRSTQSFCFENFMWKVGFKNLVQLQFLATPRAVEIHINLCHKSLLRLVDAKTQWNNQLVKRLNLKREINDT